MADTTGDNQSSGPRSSRLKYGASATGGVAVGSIFPLFLFDKLGIAQLLSHQSSFTSAVYGFTVFAMVAFLILGIGSLVVRDGQLSWTRNILFYVVVLTFVGAFVTGFGYFMYSASMRPGITVKIGYDRYSKDVASVPDLSLAPYVAYPTKLYFAKDDPHDVPITGDVPITFGMENLRELEQNYSRTQQDLLDHRFDNGTMSDICRDRRYHDNPVCAGWIKEGLKP